MRERTEIAKPLTRAGIYLRKSLKVILPAGLGQASAAVVSTAAANLQSLGFGIAPPLQERLLTLADEQVVAWYDGVLPILRQMVGADRAFAPMYPNFPAQVMEASDAELYFNAVTHYFGFMLSDALGDPSLVVLPQYETQPRPALEQLPALEELSALRWIDLGSKHEFDALFTQLAGANGALSASDREILCWFAAHRPVGPLLPASIPQKETLALLAATLPDATPLLPHVRTATDVLRLAVALSDGDVSLAEPTRFRNFSKRERRFLLGCLERTGETRTEDMLRWKERWLRLGERLHPGDFKTRFPRALAAFDALRNGTPIETFNARAEVAVVMGETAATLELLRQRPGDFARRLDHALRNDRNPAALLAGFLEVASAVATPVLADGLTRLAAQSITGFRDRVCRGSATLQRAA